MIVLQHKKRNPLGELFHKSFSEAMIKKAHVPVLVLN